MQPIFKTLYFLVLLLLIGLPNSGHRFSDADLIEKKSKFWEVYDFDIDSFRIVKYVGIRIANELPKDFHGSSFLFDKKLRDCDFRNAPFDFSLILNASFPYLNKTLPGRAPPLMG